MLARLRMWLAALIGVVRRELVAHRLFVPAGLVLGCFAPLAMLVAPMLGLDADGLHEITAVACALIFGALALAILGYSSLAPDVASGRLAFYLARPISAGALWLGRLLARFATALVATAGVLVPSLLLGGNPVRAMELIYDPPKFEWTAFRIPWHWSPDRGFGEFVVHQELLTWMPAPWMQIVGGSLLIFAGAHLVSSALRLRGPWTLVDLVAAGVGWTLLGPTLAAYIELGAIRGLMMTLLLPVAVVAAVGLAGGWAQIRWGRMAVQRSHAVLSLVLWGAMALCLVALRQDARQLSHQPLEDFSHLLDVLPAEEGSWAVMTGLDGSTKGAVTFLVDTASEVRKKLGPRTSFTNRPVFSGDGRTLFYWQCSTAIERGAEKGPRRDCHLYHLDLRDGDLRPSAIPLPRRELEGHQMAFSRDGSSLAIWRGSRVTVIEAPSGRKLWRRELPRNRISHTRGRIFFEPSGSLAVFRLRFESSGGEDPSDILAEVWSLDAESEPELRASFPFTFGGRFQSAVREYVGAGFDDGWRLLDLEGRIVHWVPPAGASRFRLLSDLRLAVLRFRGSPSSAELEIYAPLPAEETEPSGSAEISKVAIGGWTFFGAEPATDRLLVGALPRGGAELGFPSWTPPPTWSDLRTYVIDSSSGEIVRTIDGLAPLPLPRPPGALGSDWLLDAWGFPYRLDPETFELEPVLRR